jgi:zinc protease
MRRLLVLITGLLITGCAPHGYERLESLRFPELRTAETPDYIREELGNGMVLFLMQDNKIPLLHFKALIHTGSIYEPAEKTGLAEITLATIRTGGAGGISGDEVDERLDSVGAHISTGLNRDSAEIAGVCYKKDFPLVFDIFYRILTEPSFQQDKIELAIIKKKGEISRRNDDISGIADREFRRLVYGKDSPYARISEYETIDRIKRDDIVGFYNRYFCPENIILGLWGDFDSAEMLKIVKENLGKWDKGRTPPPERPSVEFPKEGSVNLIAKKDATQSVIIMGHKGLRRDHPDYFATVVLSRILGVGSYSRLTRSVRQGKGLAYEVWGSFIPEYEYPGLFIVKSQTRQDKTGKVIDLIKKEIESILYGVTDEEIAIAKESILNSEVFWSDRKDKIIQRLMVYEYYGYPFDYPLYLVEGIKKVTKEDVLETAKKHLFMENLTVLVVGEPERFDTPLPEDTNMIEITP